MPVRCEAVGNELKRPGGDACLRHAAGERAAGWVVAVGLEVGDGPRQGVVGLGTTVLVADVRGRLAEIAGVKSGPR